MADLSNSTPPRPARKRRRPAVVCAECRRRKIACDRKTPCGQCALHNVECVYVTGAVPPPYGRPLRAPVSPGSQPGVMVPGERNYLVTGNNGGGVGGVASAVGAGDGVAAAAPGGTTASASPLDDDDDVAPGAEAPDPMKSLGERSSRFGGRLAKTRLFGRSHWMNNMDEFKDIHSMTHLVHFVTGSVIYKSMRTCKRIARVIKADEIRRINEPARPGDPEWFQVLPRATADRLLDLYFNVYEPHFRILHIPTFRHEYEAFMESGGNYQTTAAAVDDRRSGKPPGRGCGSPRDVFLVKLVLVLSLGSCFHDDVDDPAGAAALHDDLRIAAARAIRAMDVAHCAPLDKHRLNLDTLQVYCLVTLARQTTALELGDDLTWFTTGGLLHTAFGMGLNRDPSHFKSLSFAQAEMRRRLWATILEFVVQASLDQGMPPLISTDDYDCAPPLNLDDDEFGLEGGADPGPADLLHVDSLMHPNRDVGKCSGGAVGGAARAATATATTTTTDTATATADGAFKRPAPPPRKGHPDSVFTQTSMQRLLCRSLPVRLRITKALNGLGAGLTYERALQLSADLLEACRYAAATLRAAPLMCNSGGVPPAERAAFAKLRIALYEILTRRFHHSLHSPFARKAGGNVQFFYSRRARIESVLRLLSFFKGPHAASAFLSDFNTPIPSDTTVPASASPSGIPMTLLRPTAAEDPCRRLWLVGRGLIKCTFVDIKSTAVIEMIHQLQEDYVPGSDLTLSQRELYDTVRTIIELAHARIEAGETNVKGYLFFRGALAQVDALMEGRPVRQTILEAAQASSERTIHTLKGLAIRKGVALPDNLGGENLGDDLDPASTSPVALQTDELGGHSSGGGNTKANNSSNNHNNSMANTGPSTAQIAALGGMAELGSVMFGDLDKGGVGMAGLDTPMGGSGADVDSAIHLPSATDISSNTSVGPDAWVDEWIMDPQGDFGFGNWFFPYNDRINNS